MDDLISTPSTQARVPIVFELSVVSFIVSGVKWVFIIHTNAFPIAFGLINWVSFGLCLIRQYVPYFLLFETEFHRFDRSCTLTLYNTFHGHEKEYC